MGTGVVGVSGDVRLLVMGGTAFVGRALTEAACAAGWRVTTFSRGHGAWRPPDGVETLHGDRTRPGDLAPLAERPFDAVVDTWREDPAAVTAAAGLLAGAVERYVYVSSLAVYRWPAPPGLGEDAPLLDPALSEDDDDFDAYGVAKVGGEAAVRAAFGGRALLARTGLVLGPYEYVGRLPWWLLRMRRGGDVLAPGHPSRPLQYVDCRDLAAWTLGAIEAGLAGAYNVLPPPGHTTMGALLDAVRTASGGDARPVWVDDEFLLAHGVRAWSELPVWLPAADRLAASYQVDVARATATGLLPVSPPAETARATWAWLQTLDDEQRRARAGQHKPWLDPARERELLAAWAAHQSG